MGRSARLVSGSGGFAETCQKEIDGAAWSGEQFHKHKAGENRCYIFPGK